MQSASTLSKLRNFGGGGFEHPNPPPRYTTDAIKASTMSMCKVSKLPWNNPKHFTGISLQQLRKATNYLRQAGDPAEIRTRNLTARSKMGNRLIKLLPLSEFITFLNNMKL